MAKGLTRAHRQPESWMGTDAFAHPTHQYADRVAEDLQSGTQSGVDRIPAIFINEVRYQDTWDIEQ
ncbi:MAG: hypothetical protein HC769_32740 [Cyanobacteria bacterium CRU_2_1]|nr:hypothetical protein [Cyanobacteria bacterium CRU_2_1]